MERQAGPDLLLLGQLPDQLEERRLEAVLRVGLALAACHQQPALDGFQYLRKFGMQRLRHGGGCAVSGSSW
jgi:hypothetical protein